MSVCWMCHGWGYVDKQETGETAWSDRTGGQSGERFPVYRLVPAFGTYDGELIVCPVCDGRGRPGLEAAFRSIGPHEVILLRNKSHIVPYVGPPEPGKDLVLHLKGRTLCGVTVTERRSLLKLTGLRQVVDAPGLCRQCVRSYNRQVEGRPH